MCARLHSSNGKYNNFYLVGAGFTKALCPNSPLNTQVIKCVTASRKGNCAVANYASQYETPNDIEQLLTRLDLDIAKRQAPGRGEVRINLQSVRHQIEIELAEYFEQFRYGQQQDALSRNPWFEVFARQVLRPNDVIAILNYDCLLEGLLDKLSIWSPAAGAYGRAISHSLSTIGEDDPPNSANIRILKLHGSEHFKYNADGGHPTGPQTTIMFKIDETIYPRSGRNRCFGDGVPEFRRGVSLIAPSFVKFFTWELQIQMLEAISLSALVENFYHCRNRTQTRGLPSASPGNVILEFAKRKRQQEVGYRRSQS